MSEHGILLVVSGPAGSGKGTVNQKLIETGDYRLSVSATTRAPRPGERDGVNYYYISKEDFQGRIDRHEMLEYTQYCGNFYGTPLKEAQRVLESGKNLILEIEVEGAMNVKRLCPDAILVMLLPPSFKVQEARLRGRGTETEESIKLRLQRTREELKMLSEYDYVVRNEDGGADACAKAIMNIVEAEKHATSRHPETADAYFAQ